MIEIKKEWKLKIVSVLKSVAIEESIELEHIDAKILIETPPDKEIGDISFPMFPFAKDFKKAPVQIAKIVAGKLNDSYVSVSGAYINISIDRSHYSSKILNNIFNEKYLYGNNDILKDEKIMLEFSSPNTNKPLHLGHLRNNIIGESISRIFKACGAEVNKVNLINNRGIHICKSMLAYIKFGNGETPESTGTKGDHFVGKYYIKFNQWSKEDSTADEQAQTLLKQWEDDDKEVIQLWNMMNKWTLEGINETYNKTDISFDKFYYESDTYLLGKDVVTDGFKNNIFYKDNDGSIRSNLSEIGLDNKVLLRSDGTSVYVTQDLGTALKRHEDYPFTKMFYVVACEQDYHFKILFHLLKKLGYKWSNKLHHLSYGMVILPDGKMKSREGTVVDADTLIETLKDSLSNDKDIDLETLHKVTVGAIHYYLLNFNTYKDIMFNPNESISFTGNTGPYMQYTGARIQSVLKKVDKELYKDVVIDYKKIKSDEEWEIMKLLGSYPEVIIKTSIKYDPSILTSFLYDLCKSYSRFYQKLNILNNEDKKVDMLRINLSKGVLQVLQNSFYLLNIPFIDQM